MDTRQASDDTHRRGTNELGASRRSGRSFRGQGSLRREESVGGGAAGAYASACMYKRLGWLWY
jgi:hypothetical protein